jgi:uncharacterized MAPEG superfamily protein
MSALTALVGFAAWTLFLVLIVFLYRGLRVLSGTPINAWPRGNKPSEDPGLVKRAEDAHANCLENLPVFAALVLAAAAMNKSAAVDPYAAYVLYARFGQSLAHLTGTSQPLVFVRATFWAIQIVLFMLMIVALLKGPMT